MAYLLWQVFLALHFIYRGWRNQKLTLRAKKKEKRSESGLLLGQKSLASSEFATSRKISVWGFAQIFFKHTWVFPFELSVKLFFIII